MHSLTPAQSRLTALHTIRRNISHFALFLTTTALTSPFLLNFAVAQSLPGGGSVAAGSAVIMQPSASTLTITQSSQSAVVNWQSFSVGQGNSVTFAQPNASSAILNRVTSGATSTIAGQVNANGQVYLVNPNGIAITKSGTINAGGGFVASTLGISDSDFMAGKRTFTGNGSSAAVSNAGTISIGRGGYAALIGGTVSNSGSIDVPLGKVGLGSGERATLDFSGDGFLQVAVPTAAGGKGALIKNSGTIRADGGSVVISAATAREAARNAINISGTVQARSIGGRSGSIVIGGGGGGRVKITGRLIATARHSTAGTIQVTGKDIKLEGATVDASGKRGGGTINIGGNYQGQGPLQRAETVSIDKNTTIKADARETGNGGNVVVWSDLLTTFAGTISARGGALSGNGGEAEVSGNAKLDYTGTTDLRAPNGITGTLLLDPYNIIISNGTQSTDANFIATANDSIINATTLSGALATANITITTGDVNSAGSQAGNITVNAPIAWSSSALLSLSAANAIAVNANININGSGKLSLRTATTTVGNTTQPLLSFGTNASINVAPGQGVEPLSINGQGYLLVRDMTALAGLNGQTGRYALATDITSSTTYTASVIGSFSGTLEGLGHTISNLTINGGSNDFVGLIGTLNSSGTVRDVGLSGGSISGRNTVGGLVGYSQGSILQSYAAVSVSATAGSVGGLVGQNDGTISRSYATGAVSSTDNRIGGLVGANSGAVTQSYATGNVSGNINVGGLIGTSANGSTVTQSFATGSVSGSISVGGLIGNLQSGSTVAQSYWDTQTSGRSNAIGFDNNNQSPNITGVTTADLANATTLAALNTGNVAFGNASNKTTPYLLNNLGPVLLGSGGASTTYYTPILTQAGLEAVNSNTSANYVLGNNIDLSGTTYTASVIGSYSGTFDGLGNTISNLTINGGNSFIIGLIGLLTNGGTLRGVGLSGGSIRGLNTVGGLVGQNKGSITQSYAAVAVSGIDFVGGLAGQNDGSITQSYATGAVSGDSGGGLVGQNNGSITQAYATGAVSGSLNGGLVGRNSSTGTVTRSYYDTQTTGQNTDAGGATGVNTATLANAITLAALNTGNVAFGNAGNKTTPYLLNNLGPVFLATDTATAPTAPTFFYPILTQANLEAVNTNPSRNYVLGNNLDLSGTTYTQAVIGSYSGTLDGLGYTVSNLAINAPTINNVGLIGTLGSGGTVRGVGAVGVNISGTASTVGGLVGDSFGTVTQSYVTGTVGGQSIVGGLLGNNHGGTVTLSYATAAISGTTGVGGLVGSSQGSITQSYATGTVNGTSQVGGLVGNNQVVGNIGGVITQAYATGAVSGGTYVGGLVGTNNGSIVQSYATGTVSGQYSGGLVSVNGNRGSIAQSYATGAVSGQYSGGLVGLNAGTIASSYWDTQTSGLNSSAGGTPVTTAQLASSATLTDLNSNGVVWGNAGNKTTPYLLNNLGPVFLASDSSATPTSYMPILTQANLEAVNNRPSANYVLANNLDLSGTTYTGAVIGSYSGTFDGLGNTIANLTINGGSNTNVGLIGTLNSGSTLRNLGTLGGSVSGGSYVGGLVGRNDGSVTLAYATGAVSGSSYLGGLVGYNNTGNITQAFATGAVTGSGNNVGGLVGRNESGAVTQAYATGAVSGGASVGGLVGSSSGSITYVYSVGLVTNGGGLLGNNAGGFVPRNSFWDTQTSGQNSSSGGGTTGVTTAQLANANTLTTLNAGAVVWGNGGNKTTPYLLNNIGPVILATDSATAPTAPTFFTPILTQANLEAVNTNPSRNYVLANNLNLGGTTYTGAVITSYSGMLDGLGNTISNLTITAPNSNNVGLIGELRGTVRNIGLVGGTISGRDNVGGLVGANNGGSIAQAYATATVSGANDVGGLVGANNGGSITQAYATGAVSGAVDVGGLVGYIAGGSITQAYATGAVSGSSEVGGLVGFNSGRITQATATGAVSGNIDVGGLVGYNGFIGTITQATATGAVSGNSDLGGLVGFNQGTITQAYWDTQTSGQGSSDGGTGLTTAQLQSNANNFMANLGTAFAGGTGGLYPYLKTFFPNGVQAVSGFAYSDAGSTPLASGANGAVNVSVLGNGTPFGTASTGANGFYYVFGQAGSIASGSSLAAYTQANNVTGAKDGATYTVATADPNNSGVNVYGGWKLDRPASSITTLSALNAFEVAAAGLSPAAAFTLANRDIRIAASNFSFDVASTTTGTLALDSTGTVTQSSNAAIIAGSLRLSGTGGAFTLTQAGNGIGAIAANTGSVTLANTGALSTGSLVNAAGTAVAGVTTTGTVSLATTGDLTLGSGAAVSGASPVLSTGGKFKNNAGANGVNATFGRWLVWSQDPDADLVGDLNYAFKQYSATLGTTTVAGNGNGLLYTRAPIVDIDSSASFDKVYDKTTTTRLLSGAGLGMTGGVAGDNVAAITGATGTFQSLTAGNNIPVSIASSSLAFADALGKPVYGYQFNSVITGNITPKLLSISLSVQSKVYDGTGLANFVLSSADVVAGDTVTFTAAQVPAFGNRNVGTYTLQATNITLGGASAANYAVSNSGAAASASITRRSLTITVDAQSRVYGDGNPVLTYQAPGLVNNDTLNGALATTATVTSGIGAYAITQGTLANSNYAITYTGANLSVTPRALTVTADTQSRVYGDANPALTYTSSGLVNGDGLTGTLATVANATSNVGNYGITQNTLAASANYALSYTGGNLTVTPRALTVTADAQSRIYGDGNKALTYQTSGLVNGDGLTGALATSANTTSNVGNYGITQNTLAASANYALTYAGANLSVTPRALTVTADAQSRVYGDGNPALTYTSSGLVNGDGLTGTLATAATTASNVGNYGITQNTLAASANYALNYVAANLSVTPRALTVTADAQSRIYGDGNPALSYQSSGLVNGDGLTGTLATAATTTSNVGNYGITQNTLAASANYALSYTGANLSVTQRALTVTADAQSRVDGDANPALTYTSSGLVNGDGLTGTLATAATTASNVGNYGITQNTLAASANYALNYVAANLSVTPRALTVTADAQSRIYGDGNPALSYQSSGLVNGDGLTGTLATAATTTSNVGNYGITQNTLAASANYALSYTGANLSVTQRALTVTADAQSRIYGEANPALTYHTSGLVNGDGLTGTLATSATTASNVGSYGITQNTLAASANYALSYVGSNLTVTPRALMVTADAQSRVYGDGNPALTYQTSGLVNGDGLTGALATSANATSNVNAYAITQNTLAASSNYALSYTGADLSVIQRALTITADAQSRIYGEANPALTYQTSGLVNSDGLSGTLATVATTASNVGNYGITQNTLAASTNYALNYVAANLSVTPRALTVTADAQSRIYGDGNPALSYQSSGLVNGDGLTGTLATAATTTSNVGNYGITQNTLAASANYALSYTGANLSVTQRALTVTADAQSRIYGDGNPALTYQASGLVNGDALTGVLATSATATSNVGSFGITQNTLTASSNYALTYVGANLSVTPRALTVTADAQSRVYGDGNPALTYQTSGLVNGDGLTGALATSATTASNVGNYGITQNTLAASANYALTYAGANLTVTSRALTVTADAQSPVYGDGNPALTYTSSGLVNGDGLTGALATSATTASNVGNYRITQNTLLASANYALTYVGANLSVTPRALTVTADAQSRIYGEANPALTYQASGLVNGDGLTGTLATNANAASNVGSYGITQNTLAASANYALRYTGANLSVTPASVVVTALGGTSVYGSSSANPGLSAPGLKNGEGVTVLTGLGNSFGVTNLSGVANSPYTLTVAGILTNPNYKVSSIINGAWSVTPAPVVVAALGGTSVFGTAPTNPGLSVTGLQNGEGVGDLNGLSNSFGITATSSVAGSPYTLTVAGTAINPNYIIAQRLPGLWTVTAAPFSGWSASTVANDNFYPTALPNDAALVFGAAPILTGLGTGTLYADPRFDSVYVCFGGGFGTAPSCYATGR